MSIENDLDLIMDFDKNYCLQIYNPLPLAFKYGKGCYLVDEKDEEYLDMIGGIAVNSRARAQKTHKGSAQAGRRDHSLLKLLLHSAAVRACVQALQEKLR